MDNGNGDEFYGATASSNKDEYKDVKIPIEDLDIAEPSEEKITSLEVNVDWSKVPGLAVGTKVGEDAANLPVVPDDVFKINSTQVSYSGCGWAVKSTQAHVEKGYLSQEAYDSYSVYDNLVPINVYNANYEISADDTYYCWSGFMAEDGYKFGDDRGENVSSIIKSNISNSFALTDGHGDAVVVFLKLGTPAEILNKNGGVIGGNEPSEPSKPSTPKFELTSEQVTTRDEVENAYVYECEDTNTFYALMDVAEDYCSNVEHGNDKLYLYVIPVQQYDGKKYVALGFGRTEIDAFVTLEQIGEYLDNGDNVYILKPYEPGGNTPGGEPEGPKEDITTDLVVADKTPVGSVSGLDKVFEIVAAENNKGYTAADQAIVAAGGSAKIYLDAKLVTAETTGSKAAADELTKAGYQAAMALDLSVIKEIVTAAGDKTTTKLIELPALISVISDIPEAYQGKAEYCIYRNHEGTVDILTTTPNADGEYIELSADGKQLILHIKKFSEYVLGYKESTTPTNPTTSTNPTTPSTPTTSVNPTAPLTTQNIPTVSAIATSPKTGEDTSMLVFTMIFALAGLSMLVVYRKMKNA